MIFDEVYNIDINKKLIKTNEFVLNMINLILSPGIQLDYSNIEGLDNNKINPYLLHGKLEMKL